MGSPSLFAYSLCEADADRLSRFSQTHSELLTLHKRHMATKRKLRIGPWILIIFGMLMLIGGLAPREPAPGENKKADNPLGVFIMAGLMIAGGGYWWFRAGQRNLGAVIQEQDKQILSVAARHHGRTTVAQIVMETDLSAQEAEEALNRLCQQNVAQPDLLDEGGVVYQFGLLGE